MPNLRRRTRRVAAFTLVVALVLQLQRELSVDDPAVRYVVAALEHHALILAVGLVGVVEDDVRELSGVHTLDDDVREAALNGLEVLDEARRLAEDVGDFRVAFLTRTDSIRTMPRTRERAATSSRRDEDVLQRIGRGRILRVDRIARRSPFPARSRSPAPPVPRYADWMNAGLPTGLFGAICASL